jgi:DNA-directed RNA polymerase subunit RPC12/RpoP
MRIKLFFTAVILGLIGFGLSQQNALLGGGLILVAVILVFASFRKKNEPRARVSVSTVRHSKPKRRVVRKAKPRFEAIGNTEATCPHCNHALDKMPGRKKKCPHCGNFMFVRTRPRDEQRVLVTEDQAEQIEEQWSIVNGTHGEYLAEKKRVSEEKARLAKRFGKEPSDNDVAWSMLNQDMMEYASQQNWGLFRNAKFQMAEILRKESRLEQALATYLEVCYIDLNGPSNMSGVTDPNFELVPKNWARV